MKMKEKVEKQQKVRLKSTELTIWKNSSLYTKTRY